MSPRPALAFRWAVGFGVAYGVLAVLSRLTIQDGVALSLVWPGAGVAMLWLLAESPRRQVRVLVPLGLVHAAAVVATGASPVITVMGSLSIVCQTWVVVLLLRRWCPTLLGAGGTESLRSPRSLAYTCLAVAIGSAVGAAIGTLGVQLDSDAVLTGWVSQAWFARHFAGLLVFGCVGHLAWERRTSSVAPRTRGGGRREFVVMYVVSAFVVAIVFLQPLPVVFLVVPLCVWSAARFTTYLAAVHAVALGVGGLLLNMVGNGPSGIVRDPLQQSLVAQIFLVTVLLTGLAVGTLSDRIDQLFIQAEEAQARAAEQAELLAEMTESMDEGLIVLDRKGRIQRTNGASLRLAHRVRPGEPDEVALADLLDLLNPPVDSTSASRAELGVGDVRVPLDSGDEIVIAVSRTVLATQRGADKRSGVLLVLQEVTEHRQGLRPLVGFASTAAHDLRGPLTAIRAWLDLAALDLADDSDVMASIARAQLASVQMAGLIDDLLAHAVAEAGDLVVDDVALTGPGGALMQAAAVLGPDDVLEVPDGGLPLVHADKVAVRQLLANLVGNAVKYSRPGVPAHIRVSAQRQGSRLVIEVEDNGVGVDENERAAIFQRFHRGTGRGRLHGTGMGLSICQAIVLRHGGSIECLPAPSGQGSVFRFDLPAATLEPVGVLPEFRPAEPPVTDDERATA